MSDSGGGLGNRRGPAGGGIVGQEFAATAAVHRQSVTILPAASIRRFQGAALTTGVGRFIQG